MIYCYKLNIFTVASATARIINKLF